MQQMSVTMQRGNADSVLGTIELTNYNPNESQCICNQHAILQDITSYTVAGIYLGSPASTYMGVSVLWPNNLSFSCLVDSSCLCIIALAKCLANICGKEDRSIQPLSKKNMS